MSDRAAHPDSGYLAAAAIIVIAAFFLRIYQIGQDELWFDEAGSFYLVTFAKWPRAFFLDNTPPLYYFFLRGWISLFGETESAIRMLSACFGTLFVAAIIWAGRRILDGRAALWAGVISAVAPIQIYYSQEARSYVMLPLLLALAYGSLWRALETRVWRWWIAFGGAVVAAAYTHYFAVLGIVPTAVLVWFWPQPEYARERWLRFAGALSASLLLFSPWVFPAIDGMRASAGKVDWIKDAWRSTGPWLAVPKSLEVFTLGGQARFSSVLNVKRFGDIAFPFGLRLMGIAAGSALGAFAIGPWGDETLNISWVGKRKLWLCTLLLFPLLALWLISFYKPVYAVGRYEIVAFPAFALLLGFAFAKLQSIPKKGPILAGVLATVFFAPIGAKLLYYYNVPPDDLSRRTTAFIHEIIRNQDVLVLSRPRAKMSIYYLTRLGYHYEDGRCDDGAGHAFACWIFPSDNSPRHTESLQKQIHQYTARLGPPDGVVWVVFDGEVLADGRLKRAQPPESLLVTELERANLQPVPYEPEYGLIYFR